MSRYKYRNCTGKVFDLCQSPFFIASFNELRSSVMEPVYIGESISGFTRRKGVVKPLRFQYLNRDRETFTRFLEAFYAAFQEDITNNTPGRIYVGDYFIEGFFQGMAVELFRRNICVSEIPFLCKEEVWTKELGSWLFEDGKLTGEVAGDEVPGVDILENEVVGSAAPCGLGSFPGNYPGGLAPVQTKTYLSNASVSPSPFKLVIFGPVESPTVIIGGHIYTTKASLAQGERLIIDSREKTITLVTKDEEETNALSTRSRDADKYIFEKIPTGKIEIRYEDIPKMILTLYDERGLPLWN